MKIPEAPGHLPLRSFDHPHAISLGLEPLANQRMCNRSAVKGQVSKLKAGLVVKMLERLLRTHWRSPDSSSDASPGSGPDRGSTPILLASKIPFFL